MLLFSIGGACLTGLLAQVRVPMPETFVPFTGQVFAVLICGALLGTGYGALSQAIYVALGAAGLPWFTGGGAGMSWLMAGTGGYLIGFVVAALFLGCCTRRSALARTFQGQVMLMLAAVAVIYTFALLHLTLNLGWSLGAAVKLGVMPFVLLDVLKVALAAPITSALLRAPSPLPASAG
jgi:biotin transport system substrate-specific component